MNHTLKRLREKVGLTQEQLAAKSGVSRGYIAMMEVGRKKAPSIETLKRLARALGVKPGALIE